MEETAGEENERSVAAPIIFTIVIAFQFLSTYIQHKTKDFNICTNYLAKEKDLAKIQELHSKEVKSSYDSYLKGLTILKVFTYFLLIWWFWGVPVAFMYKKFVEPFEIANVFHGQELGNNSFFASQSVHF
ncbi:uncharacterized protein LOC114266744 [Camellia sinensis]|uniref:uncharacterized protein LOC114266744 n=1 Tax=Camellia sinensis TaxID=4442 RepID=UPI001035B80E|nr:uncharacterized protein LOC114266744 [Camellia sinensis]